MLSKQLIDLQLDLVRKPRPDDTRVSLDHPTRKQPQLEIRFRHSHEVGIRCHGLLNVPFHFPERDGIFDLVAILSRSTQLGKGGRDVLEVFAGFDGGVDAPERGSAVCGVGVAEVGEEACSDERERPGIVAVYHFGELAPVGNTSHDREEAVEAENGHFGVGVGILGDVVVYHLDMLA